MGECNRKDLVPCDYNHTKAFVALLDEEAREL
jgi:hypothetical protein